MMGRPVTVEICKFLCQAVENLVGFMMVLIKL
jgi:hypothetical protein